MSRRAVAGMAAAAGGPEPVVIFADDFDDVTVASTNLGDKTTNSPVDQGGWQRLGTVAAVNGILCDPAGSGGPTGHIRIRRNSRNFYRPVVTWSTNDYYVQIVQNQSSPTPYGVFANWQDNDNYVMLLFTKGSSTGVQLYEYVAGTPSLLFEGDASAYPDGVDTLTRIEARGSTFRIFIDGLQFGGDIVSSVSPSVDAGLMTTPLGIGSSTFRNAGDDFEIGTL